MRSGTFRVFEMIILAIDPGSKESAYCFFDTATLQPRTFEKIDNTKMRELITTTYYNHLVIEQLKSYGAVIGDTILDTAVHIGRFIQCAETDFTLVPRKTVVSVLCHSGRAGDKEIRQVLLDRYKTLKMSNTDVRSAIALALVWTELQNEKAGKLFA